MSATFLLYLLLYFLWPISYLALAYFNSLTSALDYHAAKWVIDKKIIMCSVSETILGHSTEVVRRVIVTELLVSLKCFTIHQNRFFSLRKVG